MTAQRTALPFSKMHGIGNDFVVLDCRQAPFALSPAQVRAMGDRHTGIGFDQLLTVEPARDPASAFYYGIWNADGTPSGQCGNGVRCIAAWLNRAGAIGSGDLLRIESPSGPVSVRLLAADRVAVDMGEPDFDATASRFDGGAPLLSVTMGSPPGPLAGTAIAFDVVSMGNPHAVVNVERLDDPVLGSWGPALTSSSRFVDGVNAGFVQFVDRTRLRLRVHERGAGWTLACGTGACAAMAVMRRQHRVDQRVQVELPGGELQIDWPGPGSTLWMTGPAAFVFDGEWPLTAGTD